MRKAKIKRLVTTLTIGIPAHNEERNIGSILKSLSTQIEENYRLESIVVLCDGCTDATIDIARAYAKNDTRITVLEDGKRIGKIGRVNLLYKKTKSDIIVIFDADVRISDDKTVERIVAKFSSPGVGLVAGLELPEIPKTLRQRIFAAWDMVWVEVRKNLNNGVTVHNISGRVFALHRNFYKDLIIPADIIAEDEFLFFEVYKRKLKFAFAPTAIIFFQLPTTFREYFVQSNRFISTKHKIFEHFGVMSERAYGIPASAKMRALLRVFGRQPVSTFLAVSLQVLVRLYSRYHKIEYKNNVWQTALSTK